MEDAHKKFKVENLHLNRVFLKFKTWILEKEN